MEPVWQVSELTPRLHRPCFSPRSCSCSCVAHVGAYWRLQSRAPGPIIPRIVTSSFNDRNLGALTATLGSSIGPADQTHQALTLELSSSLTISRNQTIRLLLFLRGTCSGESVENTNGTADDTSLADTRRLATRASTEQRC